MCIAIFYILLFFHIFFQIFFVHDGFFFELFVFHCFDVVEFFVCSGFYEGIAVVKDDGFIAGAHDAAVDSADGEGTANDGVVVHDDEGFGFAVECKIHKAVVALGGSIDLVALLGIEADDHPYLADADDVIKAKRGKAKGDHGVQAAGTSSF